MAILVDSYSKYVMTSELFDLTYGTGEDAKYYWSGNINSGYNYGAITPGNFNTNSGGGVAFTPTGSGFVVAFTVRGEPPKAVIQPLDSVVAAPTQAFKDGVTNAVSTAADRFISSVPPGNITWPGGTSPSLIQMSLRAMFTAGTSLVGSGLGAAAGQGLGIGAVPGWYAGGVAGNAVGNKLWTYFPDTITGNPTNVPPKQATYGGTAYLPEEGTQGVEFLGKQNNAYNSMLNADDELKESIARQIADDYQTLWGNIADALGGAPAGTFNGDSFYQALLDAINEFTSTYRDEEEFNRFYESEQNLDVYYYDGKSITEWISILAQYIPSGGDPISLPFAIASMANTNAYVPWSDPAE